MRATLQALLVSHVWKPSASSAKGIGADTALAQHDIVRQRFALSSGTFVEVDLEDCLAKWRGRVDIIEVNQNGCAMTDLKSGSASDEHKEQLIVYSMLWREDHDRNPANLPILSLQIVYATGTVTVSVPDEDAVKCFRENLISSSESLREALNSSVVPANPSRENCRYCPVKLLCQPYWQLLSSVGSDEVLSSNELTLVEPRGDRAWLATVTASPTFTVNEKVVIRNYEGGKAFWGEMKPGLLIRLTDVSISSSEESDIPVINLSMMSEALFVG